jgi:hypothetical protein
MIVATIPASDVSATTLIIPGKLRRRMPLFWPAGSA